MSNHARRQAAGMLAVSFVIASSLAWTNDARSQSAEDLPGAAEPWLAEPGDWAADFNDAQIACYQGSMGACDSIWLNERVLMDTFLSDYGRTCGGRVNLREISRANLTCMEAFPDHE